MNYCLNFHFINHFFCNPTLSTDLIVRKWKHSHQLHWFTNCPNIYRDLTGKSKRTYRASLKTSHGHFYKWEKGTCVLGVRSLIPGDGQLADGRFSLFFNSHQLPGAFGDNSTHHLLQHTSSKQGKTPSTFFFRSPVQRNEIIIDFSRDKCFNTFTL